LSSSPNGLATISARIIDIGTGSTAIYPLLGCRRFPSWKFYATEADPDSFHYSQGNISRNFLSGQIALIKTELDGPILAPFRQFPDVE
jgi:23S rRNA A1618 N6-methylase RlmF